MTSTPQPRRRPVRRRLLAGAALVLLALAAGWLVLDRMERNGRAFYQTGAAAVGTLDRLADALHAGDWAAAAAAFDPGFAGAPLGLAGDGVAWVEDGIEAHRLGVAPEAALAAPETGARALDRTAALAEWRDYLAGFDSVEEIGLHLHRVEEWDSGGELTGTVRFELIGTPRGRPRPAIDRALFRLRFAPAGNGAAAGGTSSNGSGGPVIAAAEPLGGLRLIADRPLFTEVGAEAGIDFVNRYYPPFLEEPMRFGMIRYGPGGISAADYDGDGLYDLFVPDGVESRLYRNRGDGGFDDVTAAAGLDGLDGVSVAVFADYDNDGRRDLFVSRTFEPNQLFHNEGPDASGRVRFRDVTAGSGLGEDCCTTVASWGDVDNDGLLDLYVGRYLDPRADIPTSFYARNGEPNRLYRNLGGGRFEDVTERAGVGETGLCLGTVFGDYDDDGDADLYVVNDFGRNTLYRNRGPGSDGQVTFEDVTVESGTLAYGAGMSAAFGDYDDDGRLDIYVANIRSEHGWFAEAPTVWRYMANSWRQGVWTTDMPLYFEIFRQSGTRFVEVFQQMASGNTLLRNRGDGTFEDVTWDAGANPVGWFWGSNLGDLDLDGDQDVYSTNGWVYNDRGTEIELEFLDNVVGSQREYKTGRFFDPEHFGRRSWHGWERNRHLLNRGPGPDGAVTFEEVATPAGTDLMLNSRGAAFADFWNRGVLDVAVAASDDRHALLRNDGGAGRHWLEVELVGERSNRDGVGARVTVEAGGRTMIREVVAGDGYASQSMLRLHFGLGEADRVDRLTVRWPASGIVQDHFHLDADRILRIVEGGEPAPVEGPWQTVSR